MIMAVREDAIFSQEPPQFLISAHVLTHTVGHVKQCPVAERVCIHVHDASLVTPC